MKVSIVTVVYNNVDTIADAVESVTSQTYDDIEYIIIDGDSDDGTLNVLNNYSEEIAELVSEPDEGIFDAMNKGISQANGDIVGILNSDDFYKNERVIKKVVQEFKNNDIDAVYGDMEYVNQECSKVVRHWQAGAFDISKFEKGWMPPHPTFFVKQEAYERYGLFKEHFDIAADYELVLRFLYKHELSVSYIPEVLVQMREGGNSNDGIESRFQAFIEDYKAWKENGLKTLPGIKAQILKRATKIQQFFPFLKRN